MSNLQLTARFIIPEENIEAFKKVADACYSTTKEKDTDTLQYEWFFSEDQMECAVRETYTDSDALLTHLANLGSLFGELLALSTFSVEIYGSPSEALIKATDGMNVKLYAYYQGFVK